MQLPPYSILMVNTTSTYNPPNQHFKSPRKSRSSAARCEVNTDDCLSHDCQNGGLCRDRTAGYSCDCVGGGRRTQAKPSFQVETAQVGEVTTAKSLLCFHLSTPETKPLLSTACSARWKYLLNSFALPNLPNARVKHLIYLSSERSRM